ncbi:Replication factor C subunit 1 [Candida viswanathii]|uniref:Replication factor C subunit 1 n=1 Tax=Candida viswanathii TaxID=5486 RepID=A0A367YMU6_9ASCO|nr:Replication factor C subunit 1 [Candida viswanathii]
MVNIDDFFKLTKKSKPLLGKATKPDHKEKPKPVAKAAPKPKPKKEVIELDDDDDGDDFIADDNDIEEDDDFKDDDDDAGDDADESIVILDEPPKKKQGTSRAKTSPKKEPIKAESPKKPAKAPAKASPKKKGKKEETDQQVLDILASLPDAELPDIDPNKKVNFFELQANRNETAATTIELPAAQPNCLSGLTIVFTGQMPNLDRTTAEQTAKQYGASVTKSILGRTSLVVLGAEAGPSKVKKIRDLKIKAIDEAGFIKLLEMMPADGGSGAAAEKAKEKREKQEQEIIEQAKLEEKQEKAKEAERKARLAAAASSSSQSHEMSPPASQLRDTPAKDKLWTDRHAPTDISQLCGNKGQIKKLQQWLENWFTYQARGFKGSQDDPSAYRAVLISGPPGIGKTSAAHLVAKSLGYDVLERNASDVRSKSLLNANVKSILSNTSVVGFFKHRDDKEQQDTSKKFCIIMDEVDGMSSGDHGGAGALSLFCKITKMPMILICNDKSLPKMRTFDRVTYDLPFRRPNENEVKGRLMTIAFREKIKLDPNVIGQLVQATSNDMRQMINLLSTVSKTQKSIGANSMKEVSEGWSKQVVLKPFDIASRLLSLAVWSAPKLTIDDKLNLYFNDFDFAPLMIQENLLITKPRLPGKPIHHVAQAADDISLSDTVNSLIRSGEQQWSLLPFHGIMSTVKPSYEVAGQVLGRLNFSSWLGQNSKQMKFQRMLQELQYHTRVRTSTTKQELRLDYLDTIWEKITKSIKEKGDSGLDEAIEVMDEYYLTKEDLDNIGEMINKELKLLPKTKSAFTRKYNSAIHPTIIYKTGNSLGIGGRKAAAPKADFEDVIDDDMEDVPDDDEGQDSDKIDKKDKLIKMKPTKAGSRTKAGGGTAKKRQKK